MKLVFRVCTAAILLLFSGMSVYASSVLFSASGGSPAAIQGTVDAFRTALGTLNPNVVGSLGSGRREINWDGVPDTLSAPNNLPPNFFNVNSPRGVVFSTPGTGFQVSANAGVAPIEFDTINPGDSADFQTFSPQRLFTALDSPITDVNFFIPGTTTAAFTSGFGAVFTDVDLAITTGIQFFDTQNNALGMPFFAPVANDGLSFLGVLFDAGEQIGRVRITSGNAALGAGINDLPPTTDLVVMDDFIYGEATSAPEPSTWILLASGLALIWIARAHRLVRPMP